jgi:hypothetical protein
MTAATAAIRIPSIVNTVLLRHFRHADRSSGGLADSVDRLRIHRQGQVLAGRRHLRRLVHAHPFPFVITPTSEASMKKTLTLTLSFALALAGCANTSKDVATTYVSPMQYQNYDCDQLTAELQRMHVRVAQTGGRLDEAAASDKVAMGIGMVLFWPALLALNGSKAQEGEFARLKGEYEALQQTAVVKKCPGAVAASGPAPAVAKASVSAR